MSPPPPLPRAGFSAAPRPCSRRLIHELALRELPTLLLHLLGLSCPPSLPSPHVHVRWRAGCFIEGSSLVGPIPPQQVNWPGAEERLARGRAYSRPPTTHNARSNCAARTESLLGHLQALAAGAREARRPHQRAHAAVAPGGDAPRGEALGAPDRRLAAAWDPTRDAAAGQARQGGARG